MDRICLAIASGCIRFTLAAASDQNCCTSDQGILKGCGNCLLLWQLLLNSAVSQNTVNKCLIEIHKHTVILLD